VCSSSCKQPCSVPSGLTWLGSRPAPNDRVRRPPGWPDRPHLARGGLRAGALHPDGVLSETFPRSPILSSRHCRALLRYGSFSTGRRITTDGCDGGVRKIVQTQRSAPGQQLDNPSRWLNIRAHLKLLFAHSSGPCGGHERSAGWHARRIQRLGSTFRTGQQARATESGRCRCRGAGRGRAPHGRGRQDWTAIARANFLHLHPIRGALMPLTRRSRDPDPGDHRLTFL
jgi:hypothetical protein